MTQNYFHTHLKATQHLTHPLSVHNVQEVLYNFHSLLNILKWTRLLGHTALLDTDADY